MTRTLLAAVTSGLVLLSLAGTASAATTGPQTFFVYAAGPPDTARTVVASGPITGVGSVVLGQDVAGPGGTRIANTTWVFRDGSLFVTLTYTFQSSFDSRSCVAASHLRGTWRITGGTGRYAGATGSGTFSGPNNAYYTPTASGCSSNQYLQVTMFSYRGTVTVAQPAAPKR